MVMGANSKGKRRNLIYFSYTSLCSDLLIFIKSNTFCIPFHYFPLLASTSLSPTI